MRICMFVFNNFVNDSRVRKEAATLTAQGHHVTVLALLQGDQRYVGEEQGLEVVQFRLRPWYLRLMDRCASLSGRGVRAGANEGGNSGKVGAGGSAGLLRRIVTAVKSRLMSCHVAVYYALYHRQCLQWLQGREPWDAFHAHDLDTLLPAWLAARRFKARLVYDSHELYVERNALRPYSGLKKALLRSVEAFLARRADAVITVNESLASRLEQAYGIARPLVVMNTPVLGGAGAGLPPTVDLRRELSIPPGRRIMLYVGNIMPNRGVEIMVRSLPLLPDCHLVCLGYGSPDYLGRLESLARELQVGDRVRRFGPVPHDMVVPYARGADVGVSAIGNACLSYFYSLPNKVFEYMHAGLPVVASDFPEMGRVVREYGVGRVFNPEDPGDLARTVRELLDNPEELQRIREHAAQARERFCWEREGAKLAELYAVFEQEGRP